MREVMCIVAFCAGSHHSLLQCTIRMLSVFQVDFGARSVLSRWRWRARRHDWGRRVGAGDWKSDDPDFQAAIRARGLRLGVAPWRLRHDRHWISDSFAKMKSTSWKIDQFGCCCLVSPNSALYENYGREISCSRINSGAGDAYCESSGELNDVCRHSLPERNGSSS